MNRTWIAGLWLAGAALAHAAAEGTLETLETLIERSSAARQIEASGVAAAVAQREHARLALAEARAAAARGEHERAAELAARARSLLIGAARLAAPGEGDKAQADYERRLKSVQALLAAHQRVSAEKGDPERAAQTTSAIERLLESAARLRADGRLEPARRELDQAYLIAKASVSALRSGDTLLRSLSFASKEEEYRYEVDRNDTHQMLLALLVGERRASLEPAAARGVERARSLRAQAEASAASGAHAEAVKLLEDSTGELVRAIRSAGIYIPG